MKGLVKLLLLAGAVYVVYRLTQPAPKKHKSPHPHDIHRWEDDGGPALPETD